MFAPVSIILQAILQTPPPSSYTRTPFRRPHGPRQQPSLDTPRLLDQKHLLPKLTWWERLLELLSLLLVVKNQSVQERRASDLELGSGGLFSRLGLGRGGGGVVFNSSLLDPGDCCVKGAVAKEGEERCNSIGRGEKCKVKVNKTHGQLCSNAR